MREIKFRAWNKQNGSMIPDDFLAIDLDGEISEVDMLGDCTWKGTARCEDKYILMQYTGLKDKNGTEIYEGDLVKYLERNLVQAFGGKDDNPYSERQKVIEWRDQGFNVPMGFIRELEVIGNIYENPELLDGANL